MNRVSYLWSCALISLRKRGVWMTALAVIVGVVVGAMTQLTAGLLLTAGMLVVSVLVVALSSVLRHRLDRGAVTSADRYDLGTGSAS